MCVCVGFTTQNVRLTDWLDRIPFACTHLSIAVLRIETHTVLFILICSLCLFSKCYLHWIDFSIEIIFSHAEANRLLLFLLLFRMLLQHQHRATVICSPLLLTMLCACTRCNCFLLTVQSLSLLPYRSISLFPFSSFESIISCIWIAK